MRRPAKAALLAVFATWATVISVNLYNAIDSKAAESIAIKNYYKNYTKNSYSSQKDENDNSASDCCSIVPVIDLSIIFGIYHYNVSFSTGTERVSVSVGSLGGVSDTYRMR
ncbi:hypothetical protein GCM10008171_33950 [Methylopila jiangsuensis]|uniref:Uncharacterized protein n=2 Tax=Methylopila jiangsuensis TaxID=586230 RepID=A0A9W6JKL8_9HYPH|nr:hypothetical protein GCM10008171_33950 [Methylopila jiangsuensis]